MLQGGYNMHSLHCKKQCGVTQLFWTDLQYITCCVCATCVARLITSKADFIVTGMFVHCVCYVRFIVFCHEDLAETVAVPMDVTKSFQGVSPNPFKETGRALKRIRSDPSILERQFSEVATNGTS